MAVFFHKFINHIHITCNLIEVREWCVILRELKKRLLGDVNHLTLLDFSRVN